MPGTHPNPERHFMQTLTDIQRRLTKLEHQQNTTISNSKGQPVLNLGLIPPLGAQTSGQYGMQMLNPGTGNVGTPILQVGGQADGTYGMDVFDENGNLRVVVGEIPGGSPTYGLAVAQNGVVYMVNPVSVLYTETTTTLSNTTATQLAGQSPSSFSFTVGPSGIFAMQITAEIALPAVASATSGAEVYFQYQVNGGSAVSSRMALAQVSTGTSGTGVLLTVSNADHVTTAANATITGSLYAQATYLPSGSTVSIYGAFATFTIY